MTKKDLLTIRSLMACLEKLRKVIKSKRVEIETVPPRLRGQRRNQSKVEALVIEVEGLEREAKALEQYIGEWQEWLTQEIKRVEADELTREYMIETYVNRLPLSVVASKLGYSRRAMMRQQAKVRRKYGTIA